MKQKLNEKYLAIYLHGQMIEQLNLKLLNSNKGEYLARFKDCLLKYKIEEDQIIIVRRFGNRLMFDIQREVSLTP